MTQAQYALSNFPSDRAKAKVMLDVKKEDIRTAIEHLKADLVKLEEDFSEEWKEEKARRQAARDEVALNLLAGGMSVPQLLKLVGSKSTVWGYGLKARLDAGYKPEALPELEAEIAIEQDVWQYSDFKGTHSYAFNEDLSKLKKHGIIGTPDEGAFFVCSYDGFEFLYGDKEFFERQPKSELKKRAAQLDEILGEVYEGKIVEAPNPYK